MGEETLCRNQEGRTVNAVVEQKRTDIRGEFSFEINYQILTPEEYPARRDRSEPLVDRDRTRLKPDTLGTDSKNGITSNPWIADFLVQMDDKLNHIIEMLSEQGMDTETPNRGIGLNISGSGMKMKVYQPVESGQIIQTDFVLSRFPYIRVNLFGKVVRMAPSEEGGRQTYDLGIRFLDPDDRVIERIIARVFQLQRKAIRDSRNGV